MVCWGGGGGGGRERERERERSKAVHYNFINGLTWRSCGVLQVLVQSVSQLHEPCVDLYEGWNVKSERQLSYRETRDLLHSP